MNKPKRTRRAAGKTAPRCSARSLGEHGIVGNTGLGVEGCFHVSAPYDSNGKIFIDYGDSWKRVTRKQAKRLGETPIPCSMCKRAAVSLDHLYPYYGDQNRCAVHYGKPNLTDSRPDAAAGSGTADPRVGRK